MNKFSGYGSVLNFPEQLSSGDGDLVKNKNKVLTFLDAAGNARGIRARAIEFFIHDADAVSRTDVVYVYVRINGTLTNLATTDCWKVAVGSDAIPVQAAMSSIAFLTEVDDISISGVVYGDIDLSGTTAVNET